MGLIEKAGGVVEGAFSAPPPSRADAAPSPFDLDFGALAALGFYNPADRSSRLSLEMRSIKRRLLRRLGLRDGRGALRRSARARNIVLVTSARSGEGKTFCALNLALSLAMEEGIETLLVDADMPRPKIRVHLGLPEGPGLADRLRDPALPLGSLFWKARQAPLLVLGEGGPTGRAEALFDGAEAQRVFNELSLGGAERLVIVDAPPALATGEARLLARLADEVVFVIEANATPQAAAAAALDELLDANQNVSLLLNRCLVGGGAAYYGAYEEYGRPPAGEARDGTTEGMK